MLVYKGTEVCKIYKGSTLVQSCGLDLAPPTNLVLSEIDDGLVDPPASPTNLNLTEIEIDETPAPPTNINLTEIETAEIDWDYTSMIAGSPNDTTITCGFTNEVVDGSSGLTQNQYAVTINGNATSITSVTVSHLSNNISIGISTAIRQGDVVRLSYTQGANPLDALNSGNLVPELTDYILTNNSTTVPVPASPTNLNLEEIVQGLPPAPTNIQLQEIAPPTLGTLTIDSFSADSIIISLPIWYNGSTSGTWDLYINGALWSTYADDPISGKYIGSLVSTSVTVQIFHRDSNGFGQWSNQVVQQIGVYPPTNLGLEEIDTVVVIPDPPANLRVTNQTTISISVAFDAVAGATDYGVQWRVTGNLGWNFPQSTGGSLTYTLQGLSPGTSYDIRVYASGSWGTTDGSASITHSTDQDVGDITPPTAPTSFTSIVATEDRITATWTGATDNIGVVGYNLYIRGSDNSNFVFIKFVPGANGVWDSFENYNYLIHGSVYTIEVESVDAAGNVSPTRLRSNRIYTLVWDFSSSLYLSREMGATRYADAPSMTLGYTGWSGYRKQVRRGSVVLAGPTYNDAIAVEPMPTRTSLYYGDLDTDQDDAFDFTRQFTLTII